MKTDNFSQSAGENRAKPLLQRLTKPFGRFAGAGMMASAMALSVLPAHAQDAPVQTVSVETQDPSATVQQVSIQNPYIAACRAEDIATLEYQRACMDAANGTVVILRNPAEVSDLARDIFTKSVADEYSGSVPLEFRDTSGPTTIFLFDKNMPIDRDMLVNGSLLYVLGVRYPEKAAALNGVTPVAFN